MSFPVLVRSTGQGLRLSTSQALRRSVGLSASQELHRSGNQALCKSVDLSASQHSDLSASQHSDLSASQNSDLSASNGLSLSQTWGNPLSVRYYDPAQIERKPFTFERSMLPDTVQPLISTGGFTFAQVANQERSVSSLQTSGAFTFSQATSCAFTFPQAANSSFTFTQLASQEGSTTPLNTSCEITELPKIELPPRPKVDLRRIMAEFSKTKNFSLVQMNELDAYTDIFECHNPKARSSNGARWGDILPYVENHVENTNASKMHLPFTGDFISTCAPKSNGFGNYWEHAVHSSGVSCIVMITDFIEKKNGKLLPKADPYWPQKVGGIETYEQIEVTFISETCVYQESKTPDKKGIYKRIFSIKKVGETTARNVVQIHFTAWPDFGAPTTQLFNQLLAVIENLPEESKSKFLVHCSAGVGRTGTYMAIQEAILELNATIVDTIANGEPTVDILGIILAMREQRSGMVQTADQLEFIFKYVLGQYKQLLQEHRGLVEASPHRDALLKDLAALEGLNLS